MSPVYNIQRRMRELGRIRTGDQVPDKNGKARAHMLETFRLTSADQRILELAAEAYGGEVRPWEGGPAEGLFELYTDRSSLAIAVPPSEEPYSQWYELWSAGGCQRRCDGQRVTVPTKQGLRERDCLCDEAERECKLTTRVSVMLPDVPVLGIWRLESRGEYAARELPGVMALIASASRTGVILPGELRIEKREVKKAQEKFPRRFVVPVIDLQVPLRDLLPGGALTGGELPPPASGRPALPSGATLPDENGFDDPDPEDDEGPGWDPPPRSPEGRAPTDAAEQAGEGAGPASAPASSEGTAPPAPGPHEALTLVEQVAQAADLRGEFFTEYGVDHTNRLNLALVGALLRGAKVTSIDQLRGDAAARQRAHTALERRFRREPADEATEADPDPGAPRPLVGAPRQQVEKMSTHPDGTQRWSVASHTTADLRYTVTRLHEPGGFGPGHTSWTCECADFVCRTKGQTGELCKHCDDVRDALGAALDAALDVAEGAAEPKRCNWCESEWTGIGFVCDTCLTAQEDAHLPKAGAPA